MVHPTPRTAGSSTIRAARRIKQARIAPGQGVDQCLRWFGGRLQFQVRACQGGERRVDVRTVDLLRKVQGAGVPCRRPGHSRAVCGRFHAPIKIALPEMHHCLPLMFSEGAVVQACEEVQEVQQLERAACLRGALLRFPGPSR